MTLAATTAPAAMQPLSSAQEGLWFMQRLAPLSPAWHLARAFHLRGPLDARMLGHALERVRARQAVLRTRFIERDGKPFQVVADACDAALPETDLSSLDSFAREAALADALRHEAQQPFDLAHEGAWRVRLITLADDWHVLSVVVHHLVSDGGSNAIFARELGDAWRALRSGDACARDDVQQAPAFQYADFAVAQRAMLASEQGRARLAWWTEYVGAARDAFELPTDFPRLPSSAHEAGTHTFSLSAATCAAVRARCKAGRVTPFVVLMAAWQLLLARHANSQDFCIGVPTSGRFDEETEALVGLFVDSHVYRARIRPAMTCHALLQQVRDDTRAALDHAGVPFSALVDALGVRRDADRHPLFQTMFNVQGERAAGSLSLDGLDVSSVDAESPTARYDLSLDVRVTRDAISCTARYDSTLYRAETIARLGRHFETVLAQLCDDPARPVAEVAFIDADEDRQLAAWSAYAEWFGSAESVHRLFEREVDRDPHAPALSFGDTTLSRGELDARANRLAHRLIRLGAGPEVRVGICVERSVEMVVGLLAIMKAGGAYVPFDPSYPAARLEHMTGDSGITLLLTQTAVRERVLSTLPAASRCTMLDLDTLDVSDEPIARPDVTLHPENLAYVIYTSGSTGLPKGAANRHGALFNRLAWMQQAYGLQHDETVLQKTPFSFDVSVWEFFWPLMVGARLAVAQRDDHRDPAKLVELIERYGVSTLHFVPSMLQAFVAALDGIAGDAAAGADAGAGAAAVSTAVVRGTPLCPSLKRIICSGEALPAALQDRTLQRLPHVELHNLYGPTEAAIDVTYWACRAGDATVPIGRPIANVSTHVLDASMNRVPVGVTGELYLGGAGLARGYLNRAALTAERFVPDPFGDPNGHGERLYRTGDLARWRPDGAIEYLGRTDHQVKIRGLRIELGEIEAVLQAQPGVAEAVVVAQEGRGAAGTPGSTRLVAYVSPLAGHTLHKDALATALSEALPSHMVPTAWVLLEKLPLSPNGKVERRALPAPQRVEEEDRYEAPQGEAEQTLSMIWQQVLRVERVGRHGNFFELGGDSILSLQIVERARQAGWRISPRHLFERQTVSLLAGVAERIGQQLATSEAEPQQGEIPLLPIQAQFFAQSIPNRDHWNQAVLLQGAETLDHGKLNEALQAVVEHHDALRLRFTQILSDQRNVGDSSEGTRGIRSEGVSGIGIESVNGSSEASGTSGSSGTSGLSNRWTQRCAPYERDDTLLWTRNASTPDAIPALCDEAQRSLSIERGPLLRALAIDVEQDHTTRLLLVIHHLAIDGVSWRVLLADLQHAYAQLQRNDPATLPPKSTSYASWATRLHNHAANEALRAEPGYWQAVTSTPTALPIDNIAVGSATASTREQLTLTLEATFTQRLLQDAPAAYRTQINDLLLTALGRALCAWSGDTRIRIDVEGHGREDLFDGVDLSRTVGWFTSLYPVALEPCGEPGTAIKRVKQTLRDVPNRGIGYGILAHLGTSAEREALGHGAPSQVVFNYLGQFDQGDASSSLLRAATESTGRSHDDAAPLLHALSVGGKVLNGALTLSLAYSSARYRRSTMEALVGGLQTELTRLIEHCTGGHAGATPSDFPLAAITQGELDRLPLEWRMVADLYPLSPMQSGMLFHTLLAPDSHAYTNQLRVDLDGLDAERFRAAWQTVTARHDVLRTAFVAQGEGWLQWVAHTARVPFVEHDWRAKPDVAEALDTLAEAELQQRFDLTKPPLQRIALVRATDDRHHFVWTHHHLLLDGWSVSALLGDVLRAYQGDTPTSHGGRYRDYLAWLAQRDAAASETYWRGLVATLDEPTHLAAAFGNRAASVSRSASALAATRYTRHLLELDTSATAQLAAFARSERVTVNTLVQAAWALLLNRYTRQRTVAFGATLAGRPADLPNASHLLGLFINTVPVVAEVRADATPGDWLRAMQQQTVAAQEHAQTPLYDIQRWATGHGAQSLFDSLIVFENYPVDAALRDASPGGLTVSNVRSVDETSYLLTLGIVYRDTLKLDFRAATDAFPADVITTLAAQMSTLLIAFAAGGQGMLADIDLLDADSRTALTALSCDAIAAPAQFTPIHHAIERHAHTRPDALALIAGDQRLSYAELNARANRLAHRLLRAGVSAETRVGVALTRSADLIVGLLAVLKAGGAYVPLDPDYPAARLAHMIADSGVALIVTQSDVDARLSLPGNLTRLLIDHEATNEASEDDHDPYTPVHSNNLAYVIYTSGSTGTPKGVAVEHAALSMHCGAIAQRYGITPDDRQLHFSSISFDAATEQWLAPLSTGATLVLRGDAMWTAQRLADEIAAQRITIVDLPPAYATAFAAEIEAGSVDVKTCIVGGEGWSKHGFETVQQRLRPARLFNAYGPSETVITSTAWHADATSQVERTYAPIGRPVGERTAWVLDDTLSLVPQGAIGELYLGGAGLARGYLGRPAQTADRFVPDPFDTTTGGRLYRTGDLVRWNEAGQIEFVARADQQLKIRGFRIEPGEIEAALLGQPGVREAVVIARNGGDGEGESRGARLIAYVVAQASNTLNPAALKAALASTLPDYMVPSVFVELAAMPVTPNGKLDRAALPEPGQQDATAIEPPQGDVEIALAQIWADLLGVSQISRHANFFELGGDSIVSLQVQRRIARHWSIDLELATLFSAPTLSALATEIATARDRASGTASDAADEMRSILAGLLE